MDFSSMGQHQMPPLRDSQILFRSLLLLPVINMYTHLGLQTASGTLWCCCHQTSYNSPSKYKRVFASFSKPFLPVYSASKAQLGKFKGDWQIPRLILDYCSQMSLHQHPSSHYPVAKPASDLSVYPLHQRLLQTHSSRPCCIPLNTRSAGRYQVHSH